MPNVDPFSGFSDDALVNVHLALALSCARTKSTLRNPTRKVLCGALAITRIQLGNRGVAVPTGANGVGYLRRDKHGHVIVGPIA